MTLAELPDGAAGVVLSVAGGGALRQRLLDMGLTRGAAVRVERRAPLGDPLVVAVGGWRLALRAGEARAVLVEPAAPGPPPAGPAAGRRRGWRWRGRRGN